MPDCDSELSIETWSIHNRINLYLLAAIPEDGMSATLTGRGRTVFDLFAHIHNVRLMWLKSAAPNLLDCLFKIDPKESGTQAELAVALTASSDAIVELLRQSFASGGKIKGFKPQLFAFLGTSYRTNRTTGGRSNGRSGLQVSRSRTLSPMVSGSGARDDGLFDAYCQNW